MLRRLAIVTLIGSSAALAAGPSMTISTTGGLLRVQAPGFDFVEGAVLDRLRDGRSARFDFELAVFAHPEGPAVTKGRQSFTLGYDLWEERFAVTRIGTPPRSISHLTLKDSQAWCLEHLTVPVSELGRFGQSTPFWLRLEYQMPVEVSAPDPERDTAFTLRGLIDRLSRKPRNSQLGKSLQAGPFRLSD